MALTLPYFTFNGESSEYYGLWVSGVDIQGTPARDVEELIIPGRNGSVFLSNDRWSNLDITIHCGLLKNFGWLTSFEQARRQVMSWLLSPSGYSELKFFHVKDQQDYYYRLAIVKDQVTWNTFNDRVGTADIVFSCRPEKWLESGRQEVTVSSGDTLYNPTKFPAKPLIKVSGYGEFRFSNGRSIEIAQNTQDVIYIDCERMDVYGEWGQNLNNLATIAWRFPAMTNRYETVTYDSTFSSVKIKPRWYEL